MKQKKLINKQEKKRCDKACYFCKTQDYAVLDCHRIIPGEEGGVYTDYNTLTTCSNCHRKIHDGQIKIDRKYLHSSGKWVLHYWDETGEHFS